MPARTKDLGLRYLESGCVGSKFRFTRVVFDKLAKIGPADYSVSAGLELDTDYVVMFDMGAGELEAILALLPVDLAELIRTGLQPAFEVPVVLSFAAVAISVTARLGEPQINFDDRYAPFIVDHVAPAATTSRVQLIDNYH